MLKPMTILPFEHNRSESSKATCTYLPGSYPSNIRQYKFLCVKKKLFLKKKKQQKNIQTCSHMSTGDPDGADCGRPLLAAETLRAIIKGEENLKIQ